MSKVNNVDREGLKPMLQRLNSGEKATRQATMREFKELEGLEKVELARMAYREATQQRENFAGWWFAATLMLLFLGMRLFDLQFATCVAISAIIGYGMSRFMETSIEQDMVLELIDQVDDVALVPFALVQLQSGYRGGRRPRQMQGGRNLRNAVIRLLPHVQEADIADWNRAEREALISPLQRPFEDVEMTLAVLGVIKWLGTETALQTVRRLVDISTAMMMDSLPSEFAAPDFQANRSLIQDAARECLPELEEVVARHKQAKTLLRPSETRSPVAPETLLRPTATTDQTPTEQLLRVQSE
jgi:hypothetical protein